MKRYFVILILSLGLSWPLTALADGTNKPRHKRKAVSCNSLKGKARRTCEARAAVVARRRAEEARRRAIAFENSLRKTTADNILRDNTDGEDLRVRQTAVSALGSVAGTVVVMEAQTGKIVTIVNQDWAIRKGFPPCSTIKLVTTVAGLSDNLIPEDNEESQEGLEQALAHSSNRYFQKLGASFDFSKMRKVADELGLGKRTGINVIGESPGKVPLVKKTALVFSHGYGYELTPLQEAVMVSAIANGGKKVTPYVSRNGNAFAGQPKVEKVNLPAQDLAGAIPGMKGAAQYGTAHKGVDAALGIAGKTGTCSATGTFASVAPIDNPKYTVVVVTRGSAGKGKYAAAIAGKIYREALMESARTAFLPTEVKSPQSAPFK